MKSSILIILLAFLNFKCVGQVNGKAWLPERFVKGIMENDTAASKYLIPVEGFESFDSSPYILIYKSELSPVRTKKVTINGQEKYQLLDLQYLVNLKYNPRELANKLSKSLVYLSKADNKLLLEVIEKNRKEEIYFVDRTNDYMFTSIQEAKRALMNKK